MLVGTILKGVLLNMCPFALFLNEPLNVIILKNYLKSDMNVKTNTLSACKRKIANLSHQSVYIFALEISEHCFIPATETTTRGSIFWSFHSLS